MTKRMKTALIVLAVAAFVTAGAVILLSGSGNGYETVFNAGVRSLVKTESAAIKGRLRAYEDDVLTDDETFIRETDQSDRYEYKLDHITGKADESYLISGKSYSNVDHENKTYSFYDYGWDSIPRIDPTEDEEDTVVSLVKLFSDFFMGNAKNQFVRERTEGGNRYILSLKPEQMPDVVKLLLNLYNESDGFFGTDDDFSIRYMDEQAAVRAHYKNTAGREMDERVFDYRYYYWQDWANEDNDALHDAYYSFTDEMKNVYREMGKAVSDSACVLVFEDASAEVYPSKKEMLIQRLTQGLPVPEGLDAFTYTENASIQYIHAEFDVSDEGYITRIFIKGEGSIQDVLQKTHTYVIEAEVFVENYNNTHIELFDISEYTIVENEEKSYETVIKTAEIEFLGMTYTVNYEERVEE